MLGQVLEHERSVKDWIKLLKGNPDYRVRVRAAEALARLGDSRAVRPLIGVLGSDLESAVRGAAARALGILGDKRAVRSLISALRNDISAEVRSGAAMALGRIGDTRALKHLIFVLKRHKAESARRSAALALGHYEDEKALSALTSSLKMDPSLEVRRSAALALAGHLEGFSPSRRSSIEPIIQEMLPDPVEQGPEAVESGDAVPSTAVPTLRKPKLTCRFCGKRITKTVKACPKCGKPLSRCMICYKVIGPKDVYAACPNCGELAHLEHLQHWLTIKRVCPHCQQYLDPRRYGM